MRLLPLALATLAAAPALAQTDGQGFYRHAAIHGDTIVFSAEGDLWTVPVDRAAPPSGSRPTRASRTTR